MTGPAFAPYAHDSFSTPIGFLTVVVNAQGAVLAVHQHDESVCPYEAGERAPGAAGHAVTQLREYFAGERRYFDVDLAPRGTEFQRRVWRALCDIDYATTISYGDLAARIGQPSASRAVGMANSRNPISIIIPCHRVIGASGALVGYASGLRRKEWLLDHERRVVMGDDQS